ncbi:MAG TPA: glycosyltransferase family 4 protein [Acidimicrobiia bacterium]|nr:glycosyltransferase family 4 protein [Acidimicrobiia bacterium]
MTDPARAGAGPDDIAQLADIAAAAGLRRIAILAWRDIDDPEAGGSEIHAARVAALWGEAGIEVTMRTSFAPGSPQVSWRDGYRVIRKAGRYLVFPRAAFSEMMGWHGASDALVEIWNGMPFFSPVWAATRPRAIWLHHVHDSMWEMTLPPRLAKLGRTIEFGVAPPLYRGARIVTLSQSSKDEISRRLRLRPSNITVVPPGVDPSFRPAGVRDPDPLVLAVGRLVPVKRFDVLIDALADVKLRRPDLRAVIVGEGYERENLERRIAELGAQQWISLPGRVDDATLLDLYNRAWVLASASRHEGWGMTITEAGACRTPAVATRIAGHSDAIVDGVTGLLVDDEKGLVASLDRVLRDDAFRALLGKNALEHSSQFTWAATARGTLEVLAAEARRHKPA